MKKEKGYVYILINPSFREDWIKIGKSSREVDVRSKELDNTAVPLPFEIYATIKTSKYNELEKHLHEILTDLADKRIRKGREFFNIKPADALKHLARCAQLIEDAELNIPDNIDKISIIEENGKKKSPHYKGKYTVNTDLIFKFLRDSTDARMKVLNGNHYIVLSGSRIDSKIYSNYDSVKKLRDNYNKYIVNGVTTKDLEFTSPSTAGEFVGGGACNGKYYWRTEDGKALNDFIKYNS